MPLMLGWHFGFKAHVTHPSLHSATLTRQLQAIVRLVRHDLAELGDFRIQENQTTLVPESIILYCAPAVASPRSGPFDRLGLSSCLNISAVMHA